MFNERIKELRISMKLSQEEFGRKLNVSKQSVCNWENNNILPSVDMLANIANTFNVSCDYLLGITNKRTVDVEGLTDEQVTHIQLLVNDIRATSRRASIF